MLPIKEVVTQPYFDQQPGTSGLRKKTRVFIDCEYYLENYIQSCFEVLDVDKSKPILLGGDGRFLNDELIQKTLQIALANDFRHILLAQNDILSTPAASHLIHEKGASLAFIFSASHNPGGIEGDIGIKLNLANGGPAPVAVTEAIFEYSQQINGFKIAEIDPIATENVAEFKIANAVVKVIDAVMPYQKLMASLFDFDKIKSYLQTHHFFYDAMHAVTGPYAKSIFIDALGVPATDIINIEPKPDFAGLHPDPNPLTATTLTERAFNKNSDYVLLAASDGDGDRNLIMGKGIFVNPCDSLAVIANNSDCIPMFAKELSGGLSGVIRSMPTSRAIDVVAKQKGINCFETPTGWKFFGNLLDSGQANLCGEESFGTSANHIREKDGIWAVLCWLNILAEHDCEVVDLMQQHWQQYGRHYYGRYDFEALDKTQAEQLMTHLQKSDASQLIFAGLSPSQFGEFNYTDPVDNSSVSNQGYQVIFADKARFVVRLSGTGTVGATLRLYLEVWDDNFTADNQQMIVELADIATNFIQIKQFCNRQQADIIVT